MCVLRRMLPMTLHHRGITARPRPGQLLRNFFWPTPYDKDTTAFDDAMKPALLGEAAGVCTILRQDGVDRVYMHPATAWQLCDQLINNGEGLQSPCVGLVQQLCEALCKLPSQPQPSKDKGDSGKLSEEVTLLALARRAATSPNLLVPLSELVGKNSCITFFDTLVDCEAILQPKFKEQTFVFPRAAARVNGDWHNTDCSEMPPLADAMMRVVAESCPRK
eukprot:PhM_4_TR16142/c0_g1_i2/m.31829